jgi:hypothetical protein
MILIRMVSRFIDLFVISVVLLEYLCSHISYMYFAQHFTWIIFSGGAARLIRSAHANLFACIW